MASSHRWPIFFKLLLKNVKHLGFVLKCYNNKLTAESSLIIIKKKHTSIISSFSG